MSALLIFDNFEHLVEAGAEIVLRLLEAVPTLRCLVTSRECLRIAGEQEMAIFPLPILNASDPPEALRECPSMRLFQDRAQAIQPGFAIARHNAAAVSMLCARLEGIPLAIELAAARIGAFTPAQMLEQMADRFAFLAARRRGVPARHQTLRAAIEWSYESLPDDLKQVFLSLCIFQGGWTVESARAVAGEAATPDALERLRERSLIQTSEAEETRRFRMLETLRAYGLEKLDGEARELLSAALTHHLVETAQTLYDHYVATGQVLWLERLAEERDNFRAALDWLEASDQIDTGYQLYNFVQPASGSQALLRFGVSNLSQATLIDDVSVIQTAGPSGTPEPGGIALLLAGSITAAGFLQRPRFRRK